MYWLKDTSLVARLFVLMYIYIKIRGIAVILHCQLLVKLLVLEFLHVKKFGIGVILEGINLSLLVFIYSFFVLMIIDLDQGLFL
jgi:hypothetical protein